MREPILVNASRGIGTLLLLSAATCASSTEPIRTSDPGTSTSTSASGSASAGVAVAEAASASGRGSIWLEAHSACAIVGRDVWCWGEHAPHLFDSSEKNSDPTAHAKPTRVEVLQGAVAIDFGGFGPGVSPAGYALLGDGSGRVVRKGVVAPLPHVANAVDLAATHFVACVVSKDGSLRCVEPDPARPVLEAPRLSRVTAVAASDASGFCAVHDGGKVSCWQHKHGSNALFLEVAGVIEGVADARALSLTTELQCALSVAGKVQCWSLVGKARLRVFDVPFPEPAKAMSAGGEDVCAVLASGGIACAVVGPNAGGVIQEAKVVAGVTGATEVAVGYSSACARAAGELWCWGSDEMGQLGTGEKPASPKTPVRVAIPAR